MGEGARLVGAVVIDQSQLLAKALVFDHFSSLGLEFVSDYCAKGSGGDRGLVHLFGLGRYLLEDLGKTWERTG